MTKNTNPQDSTYEPEPKYSIELLDKFPELRDWLNELSRYRKLEDYIYISDYKKEKITLKIFTKDHYYTIVAIKPSKERPEGYLGTYGSCRKPRAGEDWDRGNDLPDGKYNRETWESFKDTLIGYELVKVVRKSPDK